MFYMEEKKCFKVGDEITFDEANQLKNDYFEKASNMAFGSNRNYGIEGGHKNYERMKREFKKKCKFKIVTLPILEEK